MGVEAACTVKLNGWRHTRAYISTHYSLPEYLEPNPDAQPSLSTLPRRFSTKCHKYSEQAGGGTKPRRHGDRTGGVDFCRELARAQKKVL